MLSLLAPLNIKNGILMAFNDPDVPAGGVEDIPYIDKPVVARTSQVVAVG